MKHLRQWMKKALAYTLVATLMVPMLAGLTPIQANAEQNPESNLILDENTESFAVEGTNSIGSLLAEEINASNGGQSNGEGYSIFGLTMENNVATVEYAVLEDCTLLVSIYDETTGQMAGSGTAAISADYYSAEVTVEAPIMPEYFIVKAYMVDSTNMKPLRSVYENTMYTKDMQELMKATVDDFDPERVLNLDADKTTNFLVYGEDTIRITADAGTNVVTSQGADSDTYTVENITEDIKALKAGDIVAIGNGADVTIVKIKEITIEGTRATIVEDDVELEEIFECIKIENESDSKEAIVDESTCGEGVTYLGKVEEQPRVLSADDGKDNKLYLKGTYDTFLPIRDPQGGFTLEGGIKFGLETEETNIKGVKCKLTGDVTLGVTLGMSFYLTTKRQMFNFSVTGALTGNIKLEGSWEDAEIEIAQTTVPTGVPGLYVSITPKVLWEASGSLGFSAAVSGEFSVKYDSGTNQGIVVDKCLKLDNLGAEVEGTFGFGISLEPAVRVISEKVLKVDAETKGIIQAEVSRTDMVSTVHSCTSCLSAKLEQQIVLEPKIEIADKKLPVDLSLTLTTQPIGECYYSISNKEFGWGQCPYKETNIYKTIIKTKNRIGNPLSGVKIIISGTKTDGTSFISSSTTDSNGMVSVAIPEGKNITILGSKDNYRNSRRTIPKWVGTQRIDDLVLYDFNKVITEPVVLKEGVSVDEYAYKNAYIKKVIIEDDAYTTNGYVFGGATIEEVVIKEKATKIPEFLFDGCTINKIEIPDNIVEIGRNAFAGTKFPEDFQINTRGKSIPFGAFQGCTLGSVVIDEGCCAKDYVFFNAKIGEVIIKSDKNVTLVGTNTGAFYKATIDKVTISENIAKLPNSMFAGASTIKQIKLPDSITEISIGAFSGVTLPDDFVLGEHVTAIGDSAFGGATLPDDFVLGQQVTTIGAHAFSSATLPKKFVIGENITTIGEGAFWGSSLNGDKLVLRKGISIGERAFYGLEIKELVLDGYNEERDGTGVFYGIFTGSTIEKVTITENATTIPDYLFKSTTIGEITIPDNVIGIGDNAFEDAVLPEGFQLGKNVNILGKSALSADTPITIDVLKIGDGYRMSSYALGGNRINELIISGDENLTMDGALAGTVIDKVIIADTVSKIPEGAFRQSTIHEIKISDNVTEIDDWAFWQAKLSEDLKLGKSIKRYGACSLGVPIEEVIITEGCQIGMNAFSQATIKELVLSSDVNVSIDGATSMNGATIEKVTIKENVIRIPNYIFGGSTILQIDIPQNVKEIGYGSFYYAKLPENFSVPESVTVATNAFKNSTYNYIPPTTSNGAVEDAETPIPEQPEDLELPPMEPEEVLPTEPEPTEQIPPVTYEEPTPVYQALPTVTQRTAKLTGLRPNDTYNFYSVKANYEFMSMEEIMAPENILYVTQVQTDANGTATITYLPREEYDSPVEFAKCMSRYDISDVKVQQEDIIYDGTQKEILPVVVYEGQQLAEYADYDVVGDFQVTDKGMYTVYIVGKNDYCGAVKVDFKVYSPDDNPFADVKESGWEYPFVKAAYDNKLMSGKSKDENGLIIFDPSNYMTRAEFVQTLYNKEGKEEVTYTARFTDVPDNQWYTDAILWAAENNIVAGKGDKFDVSGKITREEMATILYKYATNYKGYETAGRAEFTGYTDASSISNWATENMKWALHYGIMKGKKEALAPKDNATRAECATMLSNFMEAYE